MYRGRVPGSSPPPRGERRRGGRDAARRAQIRRRRGGALVLLALLAAAAGALLASHGHHAARSTRAAAAQPLPPARASRRRASAGAAQSAQLRSLIALGHPIYCAGPRGNEVALTFDDGPGPYTRLMLAKLRKHHVAATFFVVGRNIPLLPGATRAERAIGAVGDHTFTHPLLTALAPAEAESQIVRTQQALERSSGEPVRLFRPPYGAHDAAIDAIASSHGLLEILWTVDSADSLGANYAQIEHNVIAGLHPGSIILMHENHGQTIRAMLAIFAALERKHLRAVSVPQLLADDPPSAAQLRAGGDGCGLHGGVRLSGG